MKLLISGYFGFHNLGDEAILEVLRQEFAESGIELFDARRHFFQIFSSRGLISGGGGVLQDKTSFHSFIYYLALIKLAQLLKKKTFVLAQSIGPIRSKINKFLLKQVLKNCDLITLRDKASYDFIESLKLKKPKVVYTADLTFLMKPQNNVKSQTVFGISVRSCAGEDKLFPKIALAADILSQKARIQLIPFQYPEDLLACRKVINFMKTRAEIRVIRYTPSEMIGLIGQLDFLLGMRLHSLIFAVLNSTPALGISYDPKVKNFMDEVNLPWISTEDFSPQDAVSKINELLDNRAGVLKSLDFIKGEMYTRSKLNIELVRGFLYIVSI